MKLCSLKPPNREEIFMLLPKTPTRSTDGWTWLKKLMKSKTKTRKPKMKLDGRKHLPILRKDDQVGIWMDELLSLFIFIKCPYGGSRLPGPLRRARVPPQSSPLFHLNSQFHFVLFLLHFSAFPLCLSLSLFLTKQYFDILPPFIRAPFLEMAYNTSLYF